MGRYLSGILAVMLLAGCATVPKVPTQRAGTAEEYCREATQDYKVSTTFKVLAYSSNIIIVPVTAALTLGFGTVWVYPRTDEQERVVLYTECISQSARK